MRFSSAPMPLAAGRVRSARSTSPKSQSAGLSAVRRKPNPPDVRRSGQIRSDSGSSNSAKAAPKSNSRPQGPYALKFGDRQYQQRPDSSLRDDGRRRENKDSFFSSASDEQFSPPHAASIAAGAVPWGGDDLEALRRENEVLRQQNDLDLLRPNEKKEPKHVHYEIPSVRSSTSLSNQELQNSEAAQAAEDSILSFKKVEDSLEEGTLRRSVREGLRRLSNKSDVGSGTLEKVEELLKRTQELRELSQPLCASTRVSMARSQQRTDSVYSTSSLFDDGWGGDIDEADMSDGRDRTRTVSQIVCEELEAMLKSVQEGNGAGSCSDSHEENEKNHGVMAALSNADSNQMQRLSACLQSQDMDPMLKELALFVCECLRIVTTQRSSPDIADGASFPKAPTDSAASLQTAVDFNRSKPLDDWTVDEVSAWALHVQLPQEIAAMLSSHAVNGQVLSTLKEGDLSGMGLMKLGWRRQLMMRIRELLEPAKTTPASPVRQQSQNWQNPQNPRQPTTVAELTERQQSQPQSQRSLQGSFVSQASSVKKSPITRPVQPQQGSQKSTEFLLRQGLRPVPLQKLISQGKQQSGIERQVSQPQLSNLCQTLARAASFKSVMPQGLPWPVTQVPPKAGFPAHASSHVVAQIAGIRPQSFSPTFLDSPSPGRCRSPSPPPCFIAATPNPGPQGQRTLSPPTRTASPKRRPERILGSPLPFPGQMHATVCPMLPLQASASLQAIPRMPSLQACASQPELNTKN